MSTLVVRDHVARGLAGLRDGRLVLATFRATLCLSALLLFTVQPMVAKMVLPKLGGAPSVWAVSMCFFQTVLLLGYCYAHVLNRYLAQRHAPVVHLLLCALAMGTLPIAIAAGKEPSGGEPYWWLMVQLAAGVGLPFFAVSASAPLLQAWFSRSDHPEAGDPYFLYSASNIGSLVALLAYPLVIEPSMGLGLQGNAWMGGFLLLSLLVGACGALIERRRTSLVLGAGNDDRPAAPLTLGRRCGWLILAFVPSGLLVAFTSYLTTDIASAPFLWVIPLALFLTTFILVFRERPVLAHNLLLVAQPALVALSLLGLVIVGNDGWLIGVVGSCGAFFVTAMVCHRALYERRPESRHLTEFYLWMSLGGVLGGIFAALVAPQLFNALYELPLLLVLGMACRPGLRAAIAEAREVKRALLIALGAVLAMFVSLLAIGSGRLPDPLAQKGAALWVIAAALAMLSSHARPLRQVLLSAVAATGIAVLPSAMNIGFAQRSFFGVSRVVDIEDGRVRLLIHGTTVHGAERLGVFHRPLPDAPPATYYYPGSPMARGVEAARAVADTEGFAVGIVGLGAGSMACYAQGRDHWRFYEIDPVVVQLASNPALFTFLSRCQPSADIVLGDARLTLSREPAHRFDYLLIDAFSSDSVPVHMLTREALAMFLDKLKPDGLLALHITNRHLDLEGVAAAVAKSIPGTYAALADDTVEGNLDHAKSKVLFITRSLKAATALAQSVALEAPRAAGVAWSDDYSDILSVLWRGVSR